MKSKLSLLTVVLSLVILNSCGVQTDNSPSPPSQTDNSPSPPINENTSNSLFFVEDFEAASLANSFDSDWYGSMMSNPDFNLVNDNIPGSSYALSYNYQLGENADDGYATQHFGDSTKTPVYTNSAGTQFSEIFLQYKVYYSPGFDFSSRNNKNFIIGTDDGSEHTEACCTPWVAHYVTLKVGDGYFHAEANNKRGASGQWVGLMPNENGYSEFNQYSVETGRWYLVEAHIILNDMGQENGVFEQWIDGVIITSRNNVSYRVPLNGGFGTNFDYGINFLLISNYIDNVATQDQTVHYDDIKMSRSYIGN